MKGIEDIYDVCIEVLMNFLDGSWNEYGSSLDYMCEGTRERIVNRYQSQARLLKGLIDIGICTRDHLLPD